MSIHSDFLIPKISAARPWEMVWFPSQGIFKVPGLFDIAEFVSQKGRHEHFSHSFRTARSSGR